MTIEYDDRSRGYDEGEQDIIRAVDDGNAALARTFALLATQLELAVEAGDLDKADDLIGVIDRLSALSAVGR